MEDGGRTLCGEALWLVLVGNEEECLEGGVEEVRSVKAKDEAAR